VILRKGGEMIDAADIEGAFRGTDFGGPEKTDIGRRNQMVECIIKRACGYHDGYTIVSICRSLGLLDERECVTPNGLTWAFEQMREHDLPTHVMEQLQEITDRRA
jgi:hypothetical protein